MNPTLPLRLPGWVQSVVSSVMIPGKRQDLTPGKRQDLTPALLAPGALTGGWPQRADALAAWHWPWPVALVRRVGLQWRGRSAGHAADLAALRAAQQRWLAAFACGRPEAPLRGLRAQLARDGWHGAVGVDALGCAAAASAHLLQRTPYDTQLRCAGALLAGQLVEMATGEGKTLALALAALVGALAGVPVHVLTANDYLAARDADALRPLAQWLGLGVGVVQAADDAAQRAAAYAADITYACAREVAFDHLRDRLAAGDAGSPLRQHAAALGAARPAGGGLALAAAPAPRRLRGLCMALVDEADSLLIDEATLPLVLAETRADPAERAACFQALALARSLRPGADVLIDERSATLRWTEAGLARLDALCATLLGPTATAAASAPAAAAAAGVEVVDRRHRRDRVASALIALHALHAGRDYLVRDGVVELIDAATGRGAPGRVWSRGLHTLVELKEGLKPSPASVTQAQTSFQRFFARYLHLAGTSGTLAENRDELAAVYGKAVRRIAPRCASRRQVLPERWWANDAQRLPALVARIAALHAQQRPVLVGVASVDAADALAAALAAAGLPHRVLSARHCADEAAVVAQAGQPGALTMATAMAGRGTDIVLGAGVAERGGLHVIDAQDSRCRRRERQLAGRAARQGDPGSSECWRVIDRCVGQGLAGWAAQRARPSSHRLAGPAMAALLRAAHAALQAATQREGRRQRRRVLQQDLEWQRQLDFNRLHV